MSANAIHALKEALSVAFWWRNDLHSYAKAAVQGEPTFLAGIGWTEDGVTKRDTVDLFVDRLVREQDEHQDLLLALLVDVAAMEDFPGLRGPRIEDSDLKIATARRAVANLRPLVASYEQTLLGHQQARERIDFERQRAAETRATSARLAQLRAEYLGLFAAAPQPRGFALERLLREVFDVFDLDPKASFRTRGEQIDGGFTLDSEHFLLEAKWEKAAAARADVDIFQAELARKADFARGLFLAIAGFDASAVEAHSHAGSQIVLADGGCLLAVLDQRISLPDLLRRKVRHAALTGEVFLPANRIL